MGLAASLYSGAELPVELDPAVGDTLGDSKPFEDPMTRYRRGARGSRVVRAMVERVRESRVGAGGERDGRARDKRRAGPPPGDAAPARTAVDLAGAGGWRA